MYKFTGEIVRESRHPYSKKTTTKEVYVKGAYNLTIELAEECKFESNETIMLSKDKLGKQLLGRSDSGSAEAGWTENPKGPDIAISNNGKTVTRTNSSTWGNALWSEIYSSGEILIEFHIDNDGGGSDHLFIGVYNANVNV